MADYFDRLMTRARGTSTVTASPRPVTPFEAVATTLDDFEDELAGGLPSMLPPRADAPVDPPPGVGTGPDLDPGPGRRSPADRLPSPVVEPGPTAPTTDGHRRGPVPAPRSEPAPPQPTESPGAYPVEASEAIPPRPGGATFGPPAAPPKPSLPSVGGRPPVAPARPAAGPELPIGWAPRADRPDGPAPQPEPAPDRDDVAPARAVTPSAAALPLRPPTEAAEVHEETVIKVAIGRIEVRAAPAPGRRQDRPARANPQVSLDAYLERRRDRR